jgi:phosphatidate phosphatase APP1
MAPPATAEVVATGLDAVTTPNTPVRVRAKFEHAGLGPIQPDVERGKVRFDVLGKGPSDLTDRDGVAEATVTPITTGVFVFTATLEHDPPAKVQGRLWVVDPRRPVVVCDIDGTISALSTLRALTGAADAPTFEGAPELLRELGQTHQVVYLTARDDHFAAATRTFLERHRFPAGPVLFNAWGVRESSQRAQLKPGNHGVFKRKAIERLKARKLNVVFGIGDSETDAEAYEAAGIGSYINTDREPRPKSFHFTRYAALRARLVADGVLPGE